MLQGYRARAAVTNLPCERLLVISCGPAQTAMLAAYLTQLRKEVASDIQLVSTGKLLNAEMLRPAVSTLDNGVAAPHMQLAQWSQTTLVLPATDGVMNKVAAGVTDEVTSALLLASPGPVIFAPAMTEETWLALPTRRDVTRLREQGHHVIEPAAGAGLLPGAGHELGPTMDLVLTHTMHIVLKQLRQAALASEHR